MTDALPTPARLDDFIAIVGKAHALTAPDDIEPYLTENRGLYRGASSLVLKPGSTQEVAKIMALASATHTPIVPVGGRTGHVGGQVPRENGEDILLSLERLNRIREVDPVGNVVIAEAGVVLDAVHKAADAVDRLFPLSLGSQGSCQIGGNLSTNAGGTAVLTYGNMRHLCLGLEVVLPTGEIWDGLRRLKKDNSGYDLRDLFIGAEGTLGIITAAVLKLYPKPLGHEVGFAGLASPEAALKLFEKASAICGSALTGFELMPRIGVEFTSRHIENVRDPLTSPHDWYVLIDISTSDRAETARAMLETVLEQGYETGVIEDAVMAETVAQQRALWHMRESMSEAQKPEGGSIKHDVSVPVAAIPAFMREAETAVLQAVPGARICGFGHLGDGNIHYNISQPVGADKAAFIGRWREVNAIVHAIVRAHGGSISAEHGVGQLKRDELIEIRPAIETELMNRIKQAFDPKGILNPGKMVRLP
ncbi:FAD-binding oxidoreductase [Allorhizobium sp. BGMRC 0089]|uniref:FAD-binding oxidoreductase n=1 Tax=Allorhizobium sonneratiae TaxID=2934936 RepID=UPI0020336EC0|nr:FAD-binding oxidoreductase [Allorhizobium sonneratiae]MCM2294547.1 FAD-binding oxidoreductase [Allorhizobium sonneratiae]